MAKRVPSHKFWRMAKRRSAPAKTSKTKKRAKKPRRVADSLTVSVLRSTLESTADGILYQATGTSAGQVLQKTGQVLSGAALDAAKNAVKSSPYIILGVVGIVALIVVEMVRN